MSSAPNSTGPSRRAEDAFRDAFERLKRKQSVRLPKNTPISQNNVAKEAGCDPSALRKSRFPSLIAEIQRWIVENPADTPSSPRQTMLAQRRRNRTLRDKIEILTLERDNALSLLVEADAKIIELTLENLELKSKHPDQTVTSLQKNR